MGEAAETAQRVPHFDPLVLNDVLSNGFQKMIENALIDVGCPSGPAVHRRSLHHQLRNESAGAEE